MRKFISISGYSAVCLSKCGVEGNYKILQTLRVSTLSRYKYNTNIKLMRLLIYYGKLKRFT